MYSDLVDQFVGATLRFRKVNLCDMLGHDIHFGEMIVMDSVARNCKYSNGTLNVSEISTRLHVTKPAVSQILNALEGKGCIDRNICEDDRRKIAVTPTEKGHQYWTETRSQYDQAMAAMLEYISAEDMEKLIELMNQLTDIYEKIQNDNAE